MEISRTGGSRIREEVSRLKRLPVRWTAEASGDLIETLEFIAADRPGAARDVGRDVLRQSRTLAQNSLHGRIVHELYEQGVAHYRQTWFPATASSIACALTRWKSQP
jgi:plasmid stabilization system protein ParE